MKIIIDDLAKETLTPDDYKYLLLLEFNVQFDIEVRKARVKLNLPQFMKNEDVHGPLIYVPRKNRLSENSQLSVELQKQTKELMDKLGIPYTLYQYIEGLVLPGKVKDKIYSIFMYSGTESKYKKQTTLLLSTPNFAYPFIQIRRKLNRQQFISEIKKIWSDIEYIMEDFNKSSGIPKLVSHIPVREIEEGILIYRYGKRESKPNHKEIKRILASKHNIVLEEESIRKKFSEMGKLLKKLHFS